MFEYCMGNFLELLECDESLHVIIFRICYLTNTETFIVNIEIFLTELNTISNDRFFFKLKNVRHDFLFVI